MNVGAGFQTRPYLSKGHLVTGAWHGANAVVPAEAGTQRCCAKVPFFAGVLVMTSGGTWIPAFAGKTGRTRLASVYSRCSPMNSSTSRFQISGCSQKAA